MILKLLEEEELIHQVEFLLNFPQTQTLLDRHRLFYLLVR
jgi:hypothetical protein